MVRGEIRELRGELKSEMAALQTGLRAEFRGEIGGCGLEKGKLVLPLSVAEFDDGALAVSMWHVNRSLVLLSSAGEELGHAVIDYSPGDMLVDEGRLLVPDFEGNAIRVYERMV